MLAVRNILVFLFAAYGLNQGMAQTTLLRYVTKQLNIQAIAMLDLEPDASAISFTIPAPTQAGLGPVVSGLSDNSKWINYTSAVPTGTTRDVTVAVTGGTIPPGLALRLTTGAATATGAGVKGSPSGILTIETSPKVCIGGIEGCYTGNGANNGHRLTYTLQISNVSLLYAVTSGAAVITYTLVDH